MIAHTDSRFTSQSALTHNETCRTRANTPPGYHVPGSESKSKAAKPRATALQALQDSIPSALVGNKAHKCSCGDMLIPKPFSKRRKNLPNALSPRAPDASASGQQPLFLQRSEIRLHISVCCLPRSCPPTQLQPPKTAKTKSRPSRRHLKRFYGQRTGVVEIHSRNRMLRCTQSSRLMG